VDGAGSQTMPSSPTQPPSLAQHLRGYLLKRGGTLKAWKQRWFVFVEEKNALDYFRTPRDVMPLGQVCLNHASFTCEGVEPGIFHLHTPERTITLKVTHTDTPRTVSHYLCVSQLLNATKTKSSHSFLGLWSCQDLVAILQKALQQCQSEKQSCRLNQQNYNQTEEDQDLTTHLEQTQVQLEELKNSLNQKDQVIQDLKKEVRELSEKNHVKQQVIQKLSSCISRWTEQSSDVDSQSVQTLIKQNQDLQDDLKAFKNQNYFLNSEIHHLSGLWRTSTEGQRVLMNKASVQRGQHLRLLRELQEVSLREGAQSQSLRRILQDALNQANRSELTLHKLEQYILQDWDQYGFPLVQDFEVEDIQLLAKIHSPDLRTQQNQDAIERPLVARWEQYMSSCRGDLSDSPELKSLIRTGIPPHLRPQVWNWIIRTRTQRDQDPLQYQQVLSQSRSGPWSRQIDLDLPRTLCTNHNFSSPSSPALQQLRRILMAFSWENPSIGYCQGLNRIAALLLLVLGSEEDTFWGLKAVVENIMPPDYYTPSLVGSQVDQLVLKDFLSEKLARLSSHLDRCGVDVSSFTFSWFLVVFVEVLPSHILLPLWDAFLYEGNKVLFRFSLAMFKLKEPEILQLSTGLELHQYFRILPKTVLDQRRLSAVAFDELNPFSRRAVRSRRALHLERLQRELCELQRQRNLFLSQRSIHKSTEEEEGAEGAAEEEVLDNNSEDDFATVSCI
uniref:TBC1 domain family, member 2 n=1 Tax=Periophthalmus magnuspinnatus TaxID=409849 RepID=A0A3B4BK74_9GOBI